MAATTNFPAEEEGLTGSETVGDRLGPDFAPLGGMSEGDIALFSANDYTPGARKNRKGVGASGRLWRPLRQRLLR